MNDTTAANPVVYTPEAVLAMNRAYDEACDRMKAGGAGQKAQVRAGEHIMFLARNGETNQHRTCDLVIRKVMGRSLQPATD